VIESRLLHLLELLQIRELMRAGNEVARIPTIPPERFRE
jgi:hypothetical protein